MIASYVCNIYSSQALIKCMLNSPTADAAGYCNLFSVGELRQLCRREDKIMSKVKEVQDAIENMETFFKAYGKFSDIELVKLMSLMEVRCIMFMFNKKCPSRTWYETITEIMVSVVKMARSYDDKLPDMPMLAAANAAAASHASKKQKLESGFRQVGRVSDDELEAKGFIVGVLIEKADPNNKEQFKITQLNADGATINVEVANTGKAEPTPKAAKSRAKAKAKATAELKLELTLKRSDLHAYKIVHADKTVSITNIVPLTDNVAMIRSIVEGAVKQICMELMLKSSEADCIITVAKNTPSVYASKKFGIGKFSLCAVSSMIAVSEKAMSWPLLGEIEIASKVLGIYMKGGNSCIVMPESKEAKAGKKNDLLSKFYVAGATCTADARVANAEFSSYKAVANILKTKVELTVPKIVNISVLEDKAAILVLTRS